MLESPAASAAPSTIEGLAEALTEASARGQAVVPWGAGTRQHIGGPPRDGSLTLRTAALDRIVEHSPADLTATVEAGLTLGALQEALAGHGQWLPWDPGLGASATIGGLLATAAAGPMRLGYGTPRDWTLGMRVALGDGRLVKSGGRVVKNVAGYDSHKLHIGALGTLGVIAEVTFKVFPLPERFASALFACADPSAALALAARLRARPLAPVSLVVVDRRPPAAADRQPAASDGSHPSSLVVAVRFAGVTEAVERQLAAAHAAARELGAAAREIDEEGAGQLWRQLADFSAPREDGLVLRAGVKPSALGTLHDALRRHGPAGAEVLGYPGVGLAYARWATAEGVSASQYGEALARLRAALAGLRGYAVVEDAPPELRGALDRWGPPPPTLPIMLALKRRWDPAYILNRGRYVGGL